MQFGEHLAKVVAASVPCCVGIDPHVDQMQIVVAGPYTEVNLVMWGWGVIGAIHKAGIRVVKPQSALFEQFGPAGMKALVQIISYARSKGMVVILDAKRGDIGSTARGYVKAAYEAMGANSVTLNPYLGPESLEPFQKYILDRKGLQMNGAGGPGAWVLVRTSNPGAAAWQCGDQNQSPVSRSVANWINMANSDVYTHEQQLSFERDNGELDELPLGNFGAVIGATLDAKEMAGWREYMPNTWFLLPGYGAQGASAADCLHGFRRDKTGGLIVAARSVLFSKEEHPVDWRDGVYERAKAFADDVRGVL